MSNTRPPTKLDFDEIKADLINYIKSNETYSDYNFEGSALNTIIDILSYNTHNNAYYASMVHNESFLDTAQKRSSVVSRAKEMGYTPRSAVCSNAFVNVSVGFSQENENYNSITLLKGTSFTSSNDIGTYSFVSSQDYNSTKSDTGHIFSNVRLVAGTKIKNSFIVDSSRNSRSIFTIPNKGVDTSTLQVFVKESPSSLGRVEYFRVEDVYSLTPNSRVYFLQESYDGLFQIYFGSNVLGVQPTNGNIISVDYVISTDYGLPNLCKTFSFTGSIDGGGPVSASTIQVSYGGSQKEEIDSIKNNAIKSNSAKGRSVTKSDYELLLLEKFNFIKSVSVWGGEDNIPPVYGKVFISVQPISGYNLTEPVKNSVIYPVIKNHSVVTVSPVFVDPNYLYVDFITIIKFNKNKTESTRSEIETMVKAEVSGYIESISRFNEDYLESNLSNRILTLDSGISSVDIDKRVGFKLTPVEGVTTNYKNSASKAILENTITSSMFNIFVNDSIVPVSIKETKMVNSSGKMGIGIYSSSGILIQNIGYVDLVTGSFDITFSVYSYNSISRFVNIRFELVSDDIQIYRNQIIVMDPSPTDLVSGVVQNNIVVTELYDK